MIPVISGPRNGGQTNVKKKPGARSQSRGSDPGKRGTSSDAEWTALTWNDLGRWAGSRSVARGRSYQRGGRVKDLKISRDGALLATVVGGDRYVTTVALSPGRKHPSLKSACTCPVGVSGCKHAVAVVAEYLQTLADGGDVPVADEDDPRWSKLDSDRAEIDDDWDEDDEDDASWEDEDAEPVRSARSPKRPVRRQAGTVNWDDKIEQHLRARSQGELADLVWSLARRFPEIYQEFRERIALQEGDIGRLVTEARREIGQVTSEIAWQNDWTGEGHIPDYSKIRHRFERLLELGHADEVVSPGREFIAQGLRQVGEAHDEGETAMAFAECLPIVFQAVTRSRLSGPERLLFAIDAEPADDYDALDDSTEVIFDAPAQPQDWSVVADTLAQRLKVSSTREEREAADGFLRSTAVIGSRTGSPQRHDECRPRPGAADSLRIRGPGHGELRTARQVPAGSRSTSRTPNAGHAKGSPQPVPSSRGSRPIWPRASANWPASGSSGTWWPRTRHSGSSPMIPVSRHSTN